MSKWRDGPRYKISHKNLTRNHNKKMATHTVGHQEILPCTAVLILSTVSFLFISESNGSPYYEHASDRETLEPKILEYLDYFERPTISSPLKKFLDRPRVLYTLAKAAEFAVDRQSIKTQRPYRLRQIVGLRELHNNTAFWFHVVLEDGKSLKEAFFDVVSLIVRWKRKTLTHLSSDSENSNTVKFWRKNVMS